MSSERLWLLRDDDIPAYAQAYRDIAYLKEASYLVPVVPCVHGSHGFRHIIEGSIRLTSNATYSVRECDGKPKEDTDD